MRFIDLFAGIGGFRFGLEKHGHEAVYSNEWDKYARSVYRYHYGDCDGRDIRTVPIRDIPDHDLLCGGFPCQAFSIAGARKGTDDSRGTLFFEILRIAEGKRPGYLFLENVPGLLSIAGGITFANIIGSLVEIGYCVQWVCLNARYMGVPQNRERLFIIGHLGGRSRPEIFSFGEDGGEYSDTRCTYAIDSAYWKVRGKRTRTLIRDSFKGGYYETVTPPTSQDMQGHNVLVASPTSRSEHHNTADVHFIPGQRTMIKVGNIYPSGGEQGDVFDPKGISRTLKSGETSNPEHGGIGSSNAPKILKKNSIRRLTPLECERLQGFPDNWTAVGIDDKGNEVEISDTQRYKMCGNALTTVFSEYFGRVFLKARGSE